MKVIVEIPDELARAVQIEAPSADLAVDQKQAVRMWVHGAVVYAISGYEDKTMAARLLTLYAAANDLSGSNE